MTAPSGLKRSRWARPFLGALVAGVILYLAVGKLDLDRLRGGFAVLGPQHFVVVLLLSIVHISARATRYHRLVLQCGPTAYSWAHGVRIFLLGLSAAAVTPARAGDLIKARLVSVHGLGLGVGTGLVLVERILDLVVMTVCALALSFVVPLGGLRAGAALLLAIVVGAVAVCSSKRTQALLGRAVGPMASRVLGARYVRLARLIEDLLGTWMVVFRSPNRLIAFLAISFALWFVEFLKLWVLLRMMGVPALLTVVVSAYATSLIAGAISALPFSEGVVGVTLVALLASAGQIDASTASIAVVLDRAASTLPPILLWVVFSVFTRPSTPPSQEQSQAD